MKLHLIATIQKVASGYPRFMQSVHGQAIAVKTIGIISADKSCEGLVDSEGLVDKKKKEDCLTDNNQNRKKLLEDLKEDLSYHLEDLKLKEELPVHFPMEIPSHLPMEIPGYCPMGGVYSGVREKSFMVTNISMDRLLELANKYNQESVIFGSFKNEKENKMYFQYLQKNQKGKWEMIRESEGKIKSLGKNTIEKLDSSILKGHHFIIEFKNVVPPVKIEIPVTIKTAKFPSSLTDESDNNQINKVSAFKDSYLYVYLDNG